MPAIDQLRSWISSRPEARVDACLAAAVPSADAQSLSWLAELILDRADPVGLSALLIHLDRLPEPVRVRLRANPAAFPRALRRAAQSRDPVAAINLIRLTSESRNLSLSQYIADLVRHSHPTVRQLASQCLIELADHAASDLVAPPAEVIDGAKGQGSANPSEAPVAKGELQAGAEAIRALEQLETALVQALALAEEPAGALWLALLKLAPRPWPGSAVSLLRPGKAITEQLREILAAADHPTVRRSLLAGLSHPEVQPSAMQGLATAAADHLDEVLAHGWQLLHPLTARSLHRAKGVLALPADPEAVDHLPDQATPWYAHWIRHLPLEPFQTIELLTGLRRSPSTMGRLTALRHLLSLLDAALRDPEAEAGYRQRLFDAVALFTFDANESIAAAALRRLLAARWSGAASLLPRLVNTAHERVRRLAAEQLAPIAFERLWRQWPRLDESARLAAGRALIKIDAGLHVKLNQQLESGDSHTRIRALNIIAQLNQGVYFEKALIDLTVSRDVKLASAAVAALGSCESHAALVALELALEHEDSRIRANAVEALEQTRSTRHLSRLLDMAGSDDSRPRANAIKALMQVKTEEAVGALHRMLADPRPGQRRSALWLVKTLGLFDVARNVAELAVADPDDALRREARLVVHRLIDAMRAGPDASDPTSQHTSAVDIADVADVDDTIKDIADTIAEHPAQSDG